MNRQRLSTIFLIEDNPGITDALQLLLGVHGYQVDIWTEGDPLQNLCAPFPNLILLDLLLSGRDGKEVCRKLKQQESTCHIPVIVMSANKDTARIAREIGADDWIAKPFTTQTLLALLSAHLNHEKPSEMSEREKHIENDRSEKR